MDNGTHLRPLQRCRRSAFDARREFSTRMGGLTDGIVDRRTWFQADLDGQRCRRRHPHHAGCGNIPIIEAFEANGGDGPTPRPPTRLVMFYDPTESKHILASACRIYHRGGGNVITAIDWPSTDPIGADWDPASRWRYPTWRRNSPLRLRRGRRREGDRRDRGTTPTGGIRETDDPWRAIMKNDTTHLAEFQRSIERSDNRPHDRSYGQITSWQSRFRRQQRNGHDQNPRHSYASNGPTR
jgi:hypothetical protein